jgi:hypothetical protein
MVHYRALFDELMQAQEPLCARAAGAGCSVMFIPEVTIPFEGVFKRAA